MPRVSTSKIKRAAPAAMQVTWSVQSPDAHDPWRGLSADLIERFIDVLRVENKVPPPRLRRCRADLRALDRWMMQTCSHTFVSATPEELRVYFWVRVLEGRAPHRLDGLLATLHAFYRYLGECGSQPENPAMHLPPCFSESPRSKTALPPLACRAS